MIFLGMWDEDTSKEYRNKSFVGYGLINCCFTYLLILLFDKYLIFQIQIDFPYSNLTLTNYSQSLFLELNPNQRSPITYYH